jgi:cytochrome c oxidase cbb3-type subunit 2
MLLTLLALLACFYSTPDYEPLPPEVEVARRDSLKARLQLVLGEAYDAPVSGLTDADEVRGKEVFTKSCSGCHGFDGRGYGRQREKIPPPAPADLVTPGVSTFLSDAAQMQVIREGSPGTAMPPMARSLSDENLLAAYKYVLFLRTEQAATTAH